MNLDRRNGNTRRTTRAPMCCRWCFVVTVVVLPYLLLALIMDDRFLGGTLRNITGSWFNMPSRDAAAVGAMIASGRGYDAAPACADEKDAPGFPFQPFVLLTSQKTGSTWLIRKLDTHPNIVGRHIEVVREQVKTGAFGATKTTADLETVSWETYRDALIESFWSAAGCEDPDPAVRSRCDPAAEGVEAAGYKVMYDQIPTHLLAPLADWLGCTGVVAVHLVRNAFESYLSYQSQVLDASAAGTQLNARPADRIRTNDSHVAETLPSNQAPIHVAPGHASAYVTRVEGEVDLFRKLLEFRGGAIPYFEVRYEDLTSAAAERHFRATQAFLGVPEHPMADTLQKLHFGACRERVSGWPAVATALQGTEALLLCEGRAPPPVGAGAGAGAGAWEGAGVRRRRRRDRRRR